MKGKPCAADGYRTMKKRRKRRCMLFKKCTLWIPVFLLIMNLSILIGSRAAAHGGGEPQKEDLNSHRYYKCIQVNEGDTLWDIAIQYMDDSYLSAADYIEELKTINNLDSDDIHAGCYLTVTYNDHNDL